MTEPRKTARRGASKPHEARAPGAKKKAPSRQRWSHHVMETSDALDLETGVFSRGTARQIALSLKRSAERSQRRKATPFRSAMSMLNFHINRGGKGLSRSQRKVLEAAKGELRKLYGRKPHARKTHARTRSSKSASR